MPCQVADKSIYTARSLSISDPAYQAKTRPTVPTRFLVLSDTHGKTIDLPTEPVDVVIHCGDLTEESKLHEMQTTIEMLRRVDAPLKLVIPGNYDFTLDVPMFHNKLAEVKLSITDDAVIRAYGNVEDARNLFEDSDGITLLDEGTYHFVLPNGAKLTYDPQEDHVWNIGEDVNVAITHGPPYGIFDQIDGNVRGGSASLFKAIECSRPQMHCFGHMHAGWGAKVVSWRDNSEGDISYFTAIDNEESEGVESLATLRVGEFDTEERKDEKEKRLKQLTEKGYCTATGREGKTVFVNAAIESSFDGDLKHLPWIVDIVLPAADVQKEVIAPTIDRKDTA